MNWQSAARAGGEIAFIAAQKSLNQCADAVAVLRRNLYEIGYSWTQVEKIPTESLDAGMAKIKNAIGSPIPPILTMFWELVGGISLVDIQSYQHTAFWKAQNLTGPSHFCDGLYIEACSDDWVAHICDDFQDWQDYRSEDEPGYLLELSPDGYHKDNISGGAPYGVYPGISWLPVWQNFEWSGIQRPATALPGPPDILSYLRTAVLECAGFPAFLGLPHFEPVRARLLQGVPIF